MDKENLFTLPYDDEDIAGITHRFSHSTSIQQPIFSSPDNNIRWSSFNHSPSLLPLTNGDEDAWNLLCEVARMKMKASKEFFRQREYSGGVGRRVGYGHSAWGPPVKKECAGTGVFLPRGYCGGNNNQLPESRKRQACSPANLPPRMMNQFTNKTFVPVNSRPEIEARFDVGALPNYEMLMSQRNALILAAQQRRSNMHHNMHRGVMESPMNSNINPEVLLPQEWTY